MTRITQISGFCFSNLSLITAIGRLRLFVVVAVLRSRKRVEIAREDTRRCTSLSIFPHARADAARYMLKIKIELQ
jgi:hypothetical protein